MKKRTGLLLVVAIVVSGVLFAGAYYIDDGLGKDQGFSENVSNLKNDSTGGTGNRYTSKEPGSYPTERQYVNEWGINSSTEPREWIRRDGFSIYKAVNESGIHTGTTYEVTRYPNAEPTDEQLDAAWKLYNDSFKAAEENGWFSFNNGTENGYKLIENYHYINANYTLNKESLNPHKPENLMYFSKDNGRKILVGYMYLKHNWTAEGEQIGGPLTVWHYHPMNEIIRERFGSFAPNSANTSKVFGGEEKRYLGPEMLHVWFIEHPEGPFATGMEIPKENIKQPEKMTEREFKNYTLDAHKRRFGTGNVRSSSK